MKGNIFTVIFQISIENQEIMESEELCQTVIEQEKIYLEIDWDVFA
jgi:hypothetical protein